MLLFSINYSFEKIILIKLNYISNIIIITIYDVTNHKYINLTDVSDSRSFNLNHSNTTLLYLFFEFHLTSPPFPSLYLALF